MRMDGESLHSLNGILDDFFSPSSSTSVKNETSFESDQKSNSTSYPGEEDDDTIQNIRSYKIFMLIIDVSFDTVFIVYTFIAYIADK